MKRNYKGRSARRAHRIENKIALELEVMNSAQYGEILIKANSKND